MGAASVCFVLPSAYGYFNDDVQAVGGGARQLSLVSRELAETFDVHFVVGDYGQAERDSYDGVTVHRSYRQSTNTPAWRKPMQLVRLFRAMRRADADLYLYRGRPFLAAVTYALARSLRSRWVYSLGNDSNIESDPDALPGPMRSLFERALADADALVAQTEAQRRGLHDRFGVSSTVIPSGYPLAEDIRPQQNREYFLWVGRLDRDQKRPHYLLDIAAAIPDEAFEVVGPPGQDSEYTERIVERAQSLDNVTYRGSVDPDAIHSYFRDAKALVNTSAYEGFPSTFIEAWRYDTPVLSLSVPPSRYTVEAADAGFTDGDLDRLTGLVRAAADDPDRRAELSRPTYEYFTSELTLDVITERYRSLLERVLQSE